MPAKPELSHARHGPKREGAEVKFMGEYQRYLGVFAFHAVI